MKEQARFRRSIMVEYTVVKKMANKFLEDVNMLRGRGRDNRTNKYEMTSMQEVEFKSNSKVWGVQKTRSKPNTM